MFPLSFSFHNQAAYVKRRQKYLAIPACLNVSKVFSYGFLPDALPDIHTLPWLLADTPARSDEVGVTSGVRESIRRAARASTTLESRNPLLLLFLHLILLLVSKNLQVGQQKRRESAKLNKAQSYSLPLRVHMKHDLRNMPTFSCVYLKFTCEKF